MKGATMLAMLQRLGIVSSFSRPSVSNDNAYSESLFRHLKYTPAYPERAFGSLGVAADGSEKAEVFILPEKYRPSKDCIFAVQSEDRVVRVGVHSNGKVVPQSYNGWVSLDGVTFKAAKK